MRGSCGRYPTSPRLVTVPAAGCDSPASARRRVVLPAPFRPTRPTRSPVAIRKVACSIRTRGPARSSTPWALITGRPSEDGTTEEGADAGAGMTVYVAAGDTFPCGVRQRSGGCRRRGRPPRTRRRQGRRHRRRRGDRRAHRHRARRLAQQRWRRWRLRRVQPGHPGRPGHRGPARRDDRTAVDAVQHRRRAGQVHRLPAHQGL